jgi:hypothetical protein
MTSEIAALVEPLTRSPEHRVRVIAHGRRLVAATHVRTEPVA